MRARTDIGLVALLAVAACAFSALIPTSLGLLRIPTVLPLVLALPGYAIVAAFFRPRELRPAEVVLLSIALSIAVTIFAALVLEALSVRLRTLPWMGVLAAVTLAAAARAHTVGHTRTLVFRRPRVPGGIELLPVAGALLLLGGAAALGFTPLSAPKGTQGSTALWILPAPGARGGACVGLVSDQTHTASYTVDVTVAGRPAQRFGPVTLQPGAAWTRQVAVGAGRPLVQAVAHSAAKPAAVFETVALRAWSVAPAKHC